MPVAPSPQHILSQDAQDQARTHHQPKRCTTCHGPISHALPADIVCAACRTRSGSNASSTTAATTTTTTAAAAESITRPRRGSAGSSDEEGASPVVEVPLSSLEAQMGVLSVNTTPTPTTTNPGAAPLRPKPDGAPPPAVRAPRGAAPALEIQTSSLPTSSLKSPHSSTSASSSNNNNNNNNNNKFYAASPLLHTPASSTLATVPELRAARYTPDPFCDITRLRVRPRGYYCLYPGATFHGLQQSGKSSYDVHVTILDVDMDASTLCGYLRIRGLTDDWPEMTTYFDAELIGATHGFLTARWGASEKEDLLHWSRFPAFAKVKGEMAGPRWTLPERDRGAVFMRWKERFLVPDHRVQDITGASFAGFYYICVDFNPHTRGQPLSPAVSEDASKHAAEAGAGLPAGAAGRAGRRTSVSVATPPVSRTRSSSTGTARVLGSGAATMRGFYYHRNSDPYQELTLQHVTETAVSEFEFR